MVKTDEIKEVPKTKQLRLVLYKGSRKKIKLFFSGPATKASSKASKKDFSYQALTGLLKK